MPRIMATTSSNHPGAKSMIERTLGQAKLVGSTLSVGPTILRDDGTAAAFTAELSRADAHAPPAIAGGNPPVADVVAKFTPLLLTKMFEVMLPRGKAVVGEGLAGDVWRSFLSQELGSVLARQMVAQPVVRQSGPGWVPGDKQ